jgi:hypothetical protein
VWVEWPREGGREEEVVVQAQTEELAALTLEWSDALRRRLQRRRWDEIMSCMSDWSWRSSAHGRSLEQCIGLGAVCVLFRASDQVEWRNPNLGRS